MVLGNRSAVLLGNFRFSNFAVGNAEFQRKFLEQDGKVLKINHVTLPCHFGVRRQLCLSSHGAHMVRKFEIVRALKQHVTVYSPGVTTNKIELGYSHQDHND